MFLVMKAIRPLVKVSAEIFPIRMTILESAKRIYEDGMAKAVVMYEDAGQPHGSTEEGLLSWLLLFNLLLARLLSRSAGFALVNMIKCVPLAIIVLIRLSSWE